MIRDSLTRNLHLWNHHRISYKSKSPVFPWSPPSPLVLHPQSCHLPKAMSAPNKWASASNHQQRLSSFWMLHLWDLWFNFAPPTPCFLRHYCPGYLLSESRVKNSRCWPRISSYSCPHFFRQNSWIKTSVKILLKSFCGILSGLMWETHSLWNLVRAKFSAWSEWVQGLRHWPCMRATPGQSIGLWRIPGAPMTVTHSQ